MTRKRKPTIDDAYDRQQRINASSQATTLDDITVFENARNAVALLRKTFWTWIVIGEAVVRARTIADDRGGGKTFMKLIEQEGLAPIVNKSNASHLERIMAQLPKVIEWHEQLKSDQQVKWAAPSTIIKRCPVFAPQGKKDPDKPIKLTPAQKDRQQLVMLNEEVKRLEDELKNRQDGDTFNPKTSTPAEIVTALIGQLEPYRGKIDKVLREFADRRGYDLVKKREKPLPAREQDATQITG